MNAISQAPIPGLGSLSSIAHTKIFPFPEAKSPPVLMKRAPATIISMPIRITINIAIINFLLLFICITYTFLILINCLILLLFKNMYVCGVNFKKFV